MGVCRMQRWVAAVSGGVVTAALLSAALLIRAEDFPEFNRHPAQARIVTEDLDRFWSAWDLAEQDPDERRAIFQREYLDAGSAGLRGFLDIRIHDVDRLLAAIDHHPRYYASLRAQMRKVPEAVAPVRAAMEKLHAVLPEAVFPDVFLMIGAMNTGGTTHWEGVLIGVEMYGLTADTPLGELGTWHRAVLRPLEDLPAIIMHEMMHFQQANLSRTSFDTLLGLSIHEGAADFLTELVMGRHINPHLHAWARPREAELWEEFRKVMHGKDTENWLYGGDASATDDRPADLGYFIGYRIAQAYYAQATDKHAAVREIVAMKDPEAFLQASGYGQ